MTNPTARQLAEGIARTEYRSADLLQQAEAFVDSHKVYSKLEGSKRQTAIENVAQRELLRRHCELNGRRLMPDGSTRPLNEPGPSAEEIAERERQASESWARAVAMRETKRNPKPTLVQRIKSVIGV